MSNRPSPSRRGAAAIFITALAVLAAGAAPAGRSASGPAPGAEGAATTKPAATELGTAPVPAWAAPVAEARSDRFAAVRMTPEPGRPAANRDRLTHLVRRAAAAGARYVVLPELALTGPLASAEGEPAEPHAEPVPGPTFDHFAGLARELGVWIAFSLTESAAAGGYHVTSVLVDDRGRLAARVRKRVLRPNGDDGPAVVGFARVLIDTVDDRGRRLGVVSGDDLQDGIPRLADRGADAVLVNANWSPGDAVAWDRVAASLARRHGLHVVAANTHSGAGGVYPREGDPEPLPGGAAAALQVVELPVSDRPWRVRASLGLPSVPLPSHRPFTPELVELGRELFFDPGLSSTGDVSCASCHRPEDHFADGRPRGLGVHERATRRNVPSLLNVAYRTPLQWDGNPTTIEQQFKYPLTGFAELNRRDYRELLAYVRSRPGYVGAFRSGLGLEPAAITRQDVAYAIGCFLRTLVSGGSAFDRHRYGGDRDALGPAARRGLELFEGRAGCASCHRLDERWALFMDSRFHRLGVGYLPERDVHADPGVGVVSSDDYAGMFFTPSLRNVAVTAPYMHDGSVPTLEEAIRAHYRWPELDPAIEPVELDDGELADLVALLRALTGRERYGPRGERLGTPDRPDSAVAEAATSEARARRRIGRPR